MSNEHRPLVMIAVPTRGTIRHEVVSMLLRWSADTRVHKLFLIEDGYPRDAVRNRITECFLSTSAEFLITVDDDNPPCNNPIDLIFEDKDVISLPTPIMWAGQRISWNIFKCNGPEHYDTILKPEGDPLVTVDAAGAGCMVIKRRVLEAIPTAFSCVYNAATGMLKFTDDLAFSRRVLEHGFELWAHFGYCCGHVRSVDLRKMVEESGSQ